MSDAQIEGTIVQILRTMKTALHEGRTDLVPELQGKLTQCISEYMIKWNSQSLQEESLVNMETRQVIIVTLKRLVNLSKTIIHVLNYTTHG